MLGRIRVIARSFTEAAYKQMGVEPPCIVTYADRMATNYLPEEEIIYTWQPYNCDTHENVSEIPRFKLLQVSRTKGKIRRAIKRSGKGVRLNTREFISSSKRLSCQKIINPYNHKVSFFQNKTSNQSMILASNGVEKIDSQNLPMLPPFRPFSFTALRNNIYAWSFLKASYEYKKIIDLISKPSNNKQNKKNAVVPYLPSLKTYYNLLPKKMREMPEVKKFVIAMDRYRVDLSMEDKEKALNYLAFMLRPLPQYLKTLYSQIVFKRKSMSLEEVEDWVKSVPAFQKPRPIEYGEDYFQNDDGFMEEHEKRKKAAASKKAKQTQIIKKDDAKTRMANSGMEIQYGEYEVPLAKVYKMDECEEKAVNFPLEYYDNSDGFWNEFIENRKSYIKQHKVTNARPYLKH